MLAGRVAKRQSTIDERHAYARAEGYHEKTFAATPGTVAVLAECRGYGVVLEDDGHSKPVLETGQERETGEPRESVGVDNDTGMGVKRPAGADAQPHQLRVLANDRGGHGCEPVEPFTRGAFAEIGGEDVTLSEHLATRAPHDAGPGAAEVDPDDDRAGPAVLFALNSAILSLFNVVALPSLGFSRRGHQAPLGPGSDLRSRFPACC